MCQNGLRNIGITRVCRPLSIKENRSNSLYNH
nr:MAG TPA: hypothetical protein [Caudoviricetes sp.]